VYENEQGAVVPVPQVLLAGGIPTKKPVLLIENHEATSGGAVVNE